MRAVVSQYLGSLRASADVKAGQSRVDLAQALYDQAAEYISQNAYAPFLFPVNGWNIAAKNVTGPGLTTLLPASAVRPEILWAQVGFTGQ